MKPRGGVILVVGCIAGLWACSSGEDRGAHFKQYLEVGDSTPDQSGEVESDAPGELESDAPNLEQDKGTVTFDTTMQDGCQSEGRPVDEEGELRCCEGLEPVARVWVGESGECLPPSFWPPAMICLACGDGVCTEAEDKCTCPVDCEG